MIGLLVLYCDMSIEDERFFAEFALEQSEGLRMTAQGVS
jgi:hypothetical protein